MKRIFFSGCYRDWTWSSLHHDSFNLIPFHKLKLSSKRFFSDVMNNFPQNRERGRQTDREERTKVRAPLPNSLRSKIGLSCFKWGVKFWHLIYVSIYTRLDLVFFVRKPTNVVLNPSLPPTMTHKQKNHANHQIICVCTRRAARNAQHYCKMAP